MGAYIYLDGQFVKESEAKISVLDRGFLFGDGLYAVLRVQEGRALFFNEHKKHLESACGDLNLEAPSIDYAAIERLIELNNAFKGLFRLRICLTGGSGAEYHLSRRKARLLLLLDIWEPVELSSLKVAPFSHPISLCHARFKSLAHLNRHYMMQEAKERGIDDTLSLTEAGYVLEASFGNIFWVKEGAFFTPDPELPLYFGVTVQKAMAIAEKAGMTIEKVKMKYTDLPLDAYYFRTNTMGGICPISQLGVNPLLEDKTAFFQKEYAKLLEATIHLH